jgi:hypothetical protein
MIPPLTLSGVLPPFVSGYPDGGPGSMTPYWATTTEVAARFCTSPERVKLFKGLLQLRAELVALGVTHAVQWLDGSFCEDVEVQRGRPPGDIDVVTLFVRPSHALADAAFASFWASNQRVFNSKAAKATFGCEAFYIDIGLAASAVADQITYWFGLFTHQRTSNLWKGMLALPLASDDAAASTFVDGLYPT